MADVDGTARVDGPAPSGPWARAPRWLAPALVALAAVLVTLLGATTSQSFPDTRQYLAHVLQLKGEPRQQAVVDAARAWCQGAVTSDRHHRDASPSAQLDQQPATVDSCTADAAQWDLGAQPRYSAIFAARVGIAAVYLPFVLVFGSLWGMWVGAAVFAAVTSWLVFLLVRTVGGSRRAALAGQVLFLVLPVGRWSTRPLSEAPFHLLLVVALVGAAMVLRGRPSRWGPVVLGAGLLALIPVKQSTAVALGGGLVVAGAVCLFWPEVPRRSALSLAGAGIVAVGLASAWASWRGDPGLTETLQDTFTVNFRSPDVDDLPGRLMRLDLSMWSAELRQQAMAPFGLVALAVAGRAVWRKDRWVAVVAAVPLFVGLVTVVMHPLIVEASRELSTGWIGIALGLGLLADTLPRYGARRGRGAAVRAGVTGGRPGRPSGPGSPRTGAPVPAARTPAQPDPASPSPAGAAVIRPVPPSPGRHASR